MKYLCCFCGKVINSEDIICEGANDSTYTRYFCLDCFNEGLHKLNEEDLKEDEEHKQEL